MSEGNVADQMAELAQLTDFVAAVCLSLADTAPKAPLRESAWLGFWLVTHDLANRARAICDTLERTASKASS